MCLQKMGRHSDDCDCKKANKQGPNVHVFVMDAMPEGRDNENNASRRLRSKGALMGVCRNVKEIRIDFHE